MIKYDTRQLIAAQIRNEMQFARTFKQGKVKNWKKNEEMYYSRKIPVDTSRANVDLSRMQEFVHTLLSKIDNPLTFKFTKRKESQLQRVKRLNALKTIDALNNDWDIKDIAGKKQAIIYGRSIYTYFADSIDGEYKPHLENVDVYDFLIDPSAGGLDIERAMYMGNYGVVKSREDLKRGVKDGFYLKTETQRLIDGSSNATEMNQEETNKLARTQDQNVWNAQKEITGSDKFKFWNWITTYGGDRYYALVEGSTGECIEMCLLTDKFASNLFPYWTWAAFIDLTEFWTPSYCDYIRELLMAQQISINQMLDNAEQINKPQKMVSVGMIENLAELKYRKDGVIKVKGEFDVNKAYQTIITPSINTPIQVFNILEGIWRSVSGVTAGDAGNAENNSGTKVGIYEGNQANSADKFGLLNKSYAFGYKRFATLYEWGVRENLNKKIAIDMIGPTGIEQEMISRRDIFRKDDQFGVMVESSNAELALSNIDQKNKLQFLAQNAQNPIQSPKKAYEKSAIIAGFTDEEIRELMDTSDFGDEELMAEAEKDIESVLDNKKIKPNSGATTAYKQRFVTYFMDHMDDMDISQKDRMVAYIDTLDPIIIANMNRMAQTKLNQVTASVAPPSQGPAPLITGTDNINQDVQL
jgi:hypothetical protein